MHAIKIFITDTYVHFYHVRWYHSEHFIRAILGARSQEAE